MSQFCFNCMKPYDGGDFCPDCGQAADYRQLSPMLPLGTLLHGRYRIGRCVRTDGDSYTYISVDADTGRRLYTVEFFVHNLMHRAEDGLTVVHRPDKTDLIAELAEDFVDMVSKLFKLSVQSSAIAAHGLFEENNTFYYTADAPENCLPLTEVADAMRENGVATWERMRPIFDILLSDLEMLHLSGLVHRGLDATTVLLCSDGAIRLCGFSIASARIEGKGIQTTLSRDYAAPEQLSGSPYPDRTCDIYSACALIFRCVTGRIYDRTAMTVPTALFGEDVPVYAVNAILRGLDADPEKRFSNMMELRAALSGEQPAPAVDPTPTPVPDKKRGKRGKNPDTLRSSSTKVGFVLAMFGVFLVLMLGVGSLALYLVFDINIFKTDWTASSSAPSRVIHSQISTPSQTTVAAVPNFLGLKLADIEAEYAGNEKFTIQTVLSDFNDKYPRNYVMAQTPDPNTPSPGLTTIVLTVSRGPEHLIMPTVVGKTLDEAYETLTDLGFSVYLAEVDAATYTPGVNGIAYAEGVVLDCTSAAGSVMAAESTVLLYGKAERYPEGSIATSVQPDGSVVGTLKPAAQVLKGTVSSLTNADGSVTYYLQAPSFTVGFTYDYSSGTPVKIYDATPAGGSAVDTVDESGQVVRIYTPDPVKLVGTVTSTVSADGSTLWVLQPPDVTVTGEMVTTTNADGSTTTTFVPTHLNGSQIPLATVEVTLDPLTGTSSYIITPVE